VPREEGADPVISVIVGVAVGCICFTAGFVVGVAVPVVPSHAVSNRLKNMQLNQILYLYL
jgi:hypothetical protein